jgi:DNA-binding GntR family transcriptional regulator
MVVSAIREAILSGVYAPGQKLPQEHIAQALGVSRIPVRAALRHLEAEGLTVFSPHRGATVRTLEPREIAEIYDLRILLETYALRSAVENVPDDKVAELAELADHLDELGSGDAFLRLREEFTTRLFTLAGKPRTADIVARLRADVGRYWLGLRVTHEEADSHRIIIDAIKSRDSRRAEEWISRHLNAVSQELQRLVSHD